MPKVCIGYVPWENNAPFRATRSQGFLKDRKEPIKVYQTEKRALGMAPEAKPVYVILGEEIE